MASTRFDIGITIASFLREKNITEAELARKVNLPRATINRLISGRTPDPRTSTLEAIASYFKVSIDQLIGKKPIYYGLNSKINLLNDRPIPVIKWPQLKAWESVISGLTSDNHFDWIFCNSTMDVAKFAVRISSEAMWPQFHNETVLIISPNKVAKNRDYVIAYIESKNDAVFRQLILEEKYGLLTAINSIFPTIQLTEKDFIIGVLVQIRSDYS